MRELAAEEVDQISGGWAPQFGVLAVTYQQSYEAAQFFGADQLGNYIGNAVYDFMHGS